MSRSLLRLGLLAIGVAGFVATVQVLKPRPPSPVESQPTVAPLAAQPAQPVPPAQRPVAAPLSPEVRAPFDAFDQWLARWRAGSPAGREALMPEGLALARSRRVALAALIRANPEAAFAEAVPMAARAQFPADLVALLEERVSGRGELALNYACFHPPGTVHSPGDDLVRTALVNRREYRAYTYGRRSTQATLASTSLIGIAIDGDLAVSDARYRLVEPGEPLPTTVSKPVSPGELAVEADGRVVVLDSPDELPAFAAELTASEEDHTRNEADNQPGTSTVTGRPTQAWTHGTKKILLIRVDFSDLTGEPRNHFDGNALITENYVVNVINGTGAVGAFFAASSYGKAALSVAAAVAGDSPDVTGVLRMPQTAASYATGGLNLTLHSDARALATAAGFNLAAYDRVGVVFSRLSAIQGTQITYGGLANVIGPNFWINAAFDFRVVAHEVGHTFGLHHANLWKVNDGNPVSAAGTSTEYGDPFDVMGDGDFVENDFSPWNKSILQWIPDTAVTVASSANTFRIYRFDDAAANLANPRALKIVRDGTRDYWIGYRRGLANAALDGGAYVLWGYNQNVPGDLIDINTPNSNALDSPLAIGQTFNDAVAGITLRPTAQGGSLAEEWLDVEVTFQPRIQWAKTAYLVNEQGGSAVLTLTRGTNSAGVVSVNYATANVTATSGADYSAASGTLTWTNGDTADKTITVPLVADALVEGTETFSVTLSGIVGGVIVNAPAVTVTVADPGARDITFAADFINNAVNRVLAQPDGTLLIAGFFSQLQDSAFALYNHGRIARLTSAGRFDPTFNPGSGANGTVNALARQSDGKILIGGSFTSFDGTTRNRIARLNTDGSLDTTFNPGPTDGPNGNILDILPMPDGRILIAGTFTSYSGTGRTNIARLLSDGTLDTTFASPAFTGNSQMSTLGLLADGKIIVGGSFHLSGGGGVGFKSGLARLNTDGSRDAAFDVGFGAHASGATNSLRGVNKLAVQPDGKIVVGGFFTGFGGEARGRLARVNANGSFDSAFTPSADDTVRALLLQPDGRILVGGDFTTLNGASVEGVARLLSDGTPDTAFSAVGGHGDFVTDLALQSDGNVLLAGGFASFQGATPERPLWRFVPGLSGLPGTLQFSADTTLGSEGQTATLNVTRTGGSLGALTLGYSTAPGTATTADFTAATGVLTWADGESATKTITLSLTADAVAESPEAFTVNLGHALIGGVVMGSRQQATVTVDTAYGTWLSQRFTPSQIADAAITGPTVDSDGDGVGTLLEYALGLEPLSASVNGAPTVGIVNVSGADYLTLTYRRRVPTAPDLTYTPQAVGELAGGTWSPTPILHSGPVSNGDRTETVTYRDTTALSAGAKRFLRLHVLRTP